MNYKNTQLNTCKEVLLNHRYLKHVITYAYGIWPLTKGDSIKHFKEKYYLANLTRRHRRIKEEVIKI